MTKQEQIEEVSKIVDEMYNVYTTTAKDIAEGLYNSGYRKIDDKCAVITKDELNIYKKQAVKNFSEKLKEICVRKRQFIDIDDKEEYYFDGAVTVDEIDELLKEYEK